MLLNNEWVKNEIREEIKKFLEKNEIELKTMQNLCDTEKALLRRKFIAIQAYLKRIEKKHPNNTRRRTRGTKTKTAQTKK